MVSETNVVVFRMLRDGEVIGILPELSYASSGYRVTCFSLAEHHFGADHHVMVSISKLATPDQYERTKLAMERAGYKLDVKKRISQNNCFWNKKLT